MTSAIRIQASTPTIRRGITVELAGNITPAINVRLPPRRFTVLSFKSRENVSSSPSQSSISPELTSSVGCPPIQLTISQRQLTILNVAACAVAISATLLFCSAIPTLMVFKRAAESLEKLLDVTREELPDTMAAVRLSGMEISDLTTELSNLGQELTQGAKRSTNAVRMAEDRLRRFANMTPRAPMQEVIDTKSTITEPAVARTARGMREGIVKGRTVLSMVFGITRFSTSIVGYFSKRSRKKALNK